MRKTIKQERKPDPEVGFKEKIIMGTSVDIKFMSQNEKFELLDKLWIDLGRNPTQLNLSDDQLKELDVRLDRMEQEGTSGLSWNDVCLIARGQIK